MKSLLSLLLTVSIFFTSQAQTLPIQKARTYQTNIFDDGGTEIIAWDRNTKRIFSTNASLNVLDILDITDITKPNKVASIDLSPYISSPTSVAAHSGLVAVVGIATSPQSSGKVLFFDSNGNFENQFSVGALPDMVGFSPGGNKLLIANEGEPTDDYTTDPAGSVTVIDVSIGVNNLTQSNIISIPFTPLDSQAIHPLVLTYGNNGQQLVSQDLEPEYVSANSSLTKAYVSLQENNAIMIIDLTTNTIDTVIGLGYIDRGVAGNGLDASDVNQTIDIKTYSRLFSMFQPDAISAFEVGGATYIASANEGDPRDYTGYSEITRVNSTILHPGKFTNVSSLINDNNLGRLEITKELGDNDGDGLYDSIFTFGTRSFSIWDENLQLIWDSGDDFEQIIAMAHPTTFNSDNDDNNSYKSRSDNRGPEPEAIAIGEVDGTLYAFIGMERMGGFMVYDISNPSSPQFELYELNRDFSKPANDPDVGDLGPESIVFVPEFESPTGIALVITANEVSGTISIYEIGQGIGLDEEVDSRYLKAYPNPSSGEVNLNHYGDYQVFDSSGKLIHTVKDANQLNLKDLKEGLYIIKDAEGNVIRIIRRD